jgi:hypothetical protein
MNLICPPSSARLQRATAVLFGLEGRKGLRSAGLRLAAQRVDAEAGLGEAKLFFPPARATRSDWLVGGGLRALAIAH